MKRDSLSVDPYKDCDVCVAMRDSGAFEEVDIQNYHDGVLVFENFNARQRDVLTRIFEQEK